MAHETRMFMNTVNDVYLYLYLYLYHGAWVVAMVASFDVPHEIYAHNWIQLGLYAIHNVLYMYICVCVSHAEDMLMCHYGGAQPMNGCGM